MQHKLLTLLLIVFGITAVLGRSQIRFMNARFYSGQTVDITTNIYSINQTSMALPSRYNAMTDDIPVTSYVQLPTSSIPEGSYVTFYAYDKDDLVIPVNVLANRSVETLRTQSYTLVYVDRTDDSFGDAVTDVPAQLFIFEELIPQAGSFLKIVNVAAASYPYGNLMVTLDRYGVVYVPYGSDSGFLEIAPGLLNVTVYLPGTTKSLYITLTNFTATLYIRGDIATATYFGYDLVEHDPQEYWSFEPTSPPVYPTTPTSAPTSAPVSNGPLPVQIRYLNTYSLGLYAFALFDQNYNVVQNVTTSALNTGYQTLYNAGYYFISVSNYDFAGGVNAWLQAGYRYTVFYSNVNSWTILEDSPVGYNNYNQSYLRIVNNVPGSSFIQLYTPSQGWNTWYSDNGEIWYPQFLTGSSGESVLYIDTGNQTVYESFYLNAGMATTIYLYGTENVTVYIDQQPLIVVPTEPVCVNGYVESNGVCNCYAGYTSDASPYKCTVVAPYYCFRNQSDALSNDYVPYIPYWTAQVYGNQLSFSVYSDIVAGRRTLVELPNSQCSFINSPQYYQKYNSGCEDRLDVNIPFTECGFTKTSTSTEDVYKGTVHVKQIDRVTVAGTTYDRVIDTPMPIAIRMPKTLAIESYVQVYGPPSLAIDAAFVGQTVSTESQSGNLQYMSAVQYPLQIETVQLVDLPYGVSAWIEVVNVNCSSVGPCVQRLEVHLNTSSCSISGVYRMVVSLSCRSDQGCPDEAKNGTQVYIESRIVSQSLCGEMSVDIDLNGYIQAFTDQSFSNPALAFYPGQSAYFLINAYSSRVSLSKVSIESVYYYGPNINYQYLSYNTSLSNIAIANNFTTGTQGTSQAWFGLDVSVSTPNSGDNSTLFKLYQGQNGVYNFVAIVDVEWYVSNNAPSVTPYANQPSSTTTPTNTPIAYAPSYEPQPSFKKRMVLQGALSNQGSQFTAQVQVAGPTPSSQQPPQQQQQQTPVAANPGTTDNKPVSSGVSLSSSLIVIAVAFVALF